MTARLAAHVEVSALVRRVAAAGGFAAVVARGDREAGAILLLIAERGVARGLLERRLSDSGAYRWSPTGPENILNLQLVNDYVANRRRIDRDLWVVELDIADSERFTAEMTAMG